MTLSIRKPMMPPTNIDVLSSTMHTLSNVSFPVSSHAHQTHTNTQHVTPEYKITFTMAVYHILTEVVGASRMSSYATAAAALYEPPQ